MGARGVPSFLWLDYLIHSLVNSAMTLPTETGLWSITIVMSRGGKGS